MPHDIFVSYSRRDLATVKSIKEELEAAGFSCWMDIEGIESGVENFKRKIVPALDRCSFVLFFISSDSQKSEWTDKELGYAKRHGKRVVPLRFNDDPLVGEFDFDYGGSDVIDWRAPEQKEKLLHDLGKWLGHRPVRRSGKPVRPASARSAPIMTRKDSPLRVRFSEWSSFGRRLGCFCMTITNRSRIPIGITITVRNGSRRTSYDHTIKGGKSENFNILGLSWRFTAGDKGTVKTSGHRAIRFEILKDSTYRVE